MNKQIEIRWLVFLMALCAISFGLPTGFSLRGSMDIQVHDTYYVIENIDLLSLLILTIATSYLLTVGLKISANVNSVLKFCSMVITGLIGFGLCCLLVIVITWIIIITGSVWDLTGFGLIILVSGLAVLFLLRTREIRKNK